MRKILFRAKRLDNGEWIHGYYATKGVDDKTLKHFICEPTFDPNGSCYCGMFYLMDYEVNPDTVGQFTNKQDKNGVEIYEGDIVKVDVSTYKLTDRRVKHRYYEKCLVVWSCNSHTRHLNEYEKDRLEVIGNIHDNPELLKGGEK